ncbi:hypothetical protein DICPUDRAFT_32669 [Dictyostelium purpureum]|uniref:Uncharacterized protein n=1 Tax=Dictyostelium purpureum TaxID=5786 RepID=F0ZJL5_DICPU|nr:uncharacterized protein DICPUDRAFT_32669 [Dictyostelium purpureum]EGC35867.1 hypothetical protein DICPUDRAFT_32669 [Dictyostelium purpureum]|eukprot:XP_003287598.1 hypothetical protein DICPUDRAFT_32669 [Dictyostelium purpureum]
MTESTKVAKTVVNKKERTIDIVIAHKLNSGSSNFKQQALIKLRTAVKHEKLSEIQLLKIWKGLFLSFYNTDKLVVQDEVSTKIAELTTLFKDYNDSFLFVKCFFITLQNHWNHIDQYRVDKFYLLSRKIVHSSFKLLKKYYVAPKEGEELQNKSNDEIYSGLVKVFKDTVLNPKNSTLTNGIVLHFADIYLEELFKVTQGAMDPFYLTKILLPFINFLSKSEDDVACRRIKERVFTRLVTTYSIFEKKDAFYLPKEGIRYSDDKPELFIVDYGMLSKLFFKCASSKTTLEVNRKMMYSLKNQMNRAYLAFKEIEESADNILDENGNYINPEMEEEIEGEEEEEIVEDEDDEEIEDGEEIEDDEEIEGDADIDDEEDDEEMEGDADIDDDDDEFNEDIEEEEEVPPPKNNKKNNNSKPQQKSQPQQKKPQSQQKPQPQQKKQPQKPQQTKVSSKKAPTKKSNK